MRNESPWQTCVVKVHFVGCTQPGPNELAHVCKPNPKRHQQEAKDWEWTTSSCSCLTKIQLETPQENQAFEDELGAVPSVFYHPLPDMNSAQGLSYQLKTKEWWNSIIFLKTAPLVERELKPNYPNFNKLMLKMLKTFKTWFMCQAHES